MRPCEALRPISSAHFFVVGVVGPSVCDTKISRFVAYEKTFALFFSQTNLKMSKTRPIYLLILFVSEEVH